MNPPRLQVVDGTEAISNSVYRLNDFIWIDTELPGEQFRDGIASAIKSKKRNLRDRIPQLIPDLTSEQTTAFIVSPRNFPRLLGLLKERTPDQAGAVVHIAGNKISLEENAAPKIFLSGSIQEAVDFSTLAHLEALARSQIILHLFDGGRLSGEMEKIDMISEETLHLLLEEGNDFSKLLTRFTDTTGRHVAPVDYIGHPEAEKVFVTMGPVSADLRAVLPPPAEGQRVGLLKVRFLAPFDSKDFVQKIPGTVQTLYTLEHPTLYLKVLNALHEGMVNRWSWFATLPRLVKFKSAEGALIAAGVSPSSVAEGLCVRWEGLPADGSLGLVRDLLTLLSGSCAIQACLLPSDDSQADLQIRLAHTPFVNNEIIIQPDIWIRHQNRRLSSHEEVQTATLAVTSLLKNILQLAHQKDLPLDEGACRQRWRELVEDHFRPLGPVFARLNTEASDNVWAGESSTLVESPVVIQTASPISQTLPLQLSTQRLCVLHRTLDQVPDDFGAVVLPLLRESDLQKGILEFYRTRVRRLSFQAARATLTDQAFGLAAVLDDIQSLRAHIHQPLIARLSASTPDSWAGIAADLQEAGVKALEAVFADGETIQNRLVVLKRLKSALRIPVFVSFVLFEKISENTLRELQEAGADGFVFFQEWPQRDYDLRSQSWTEDTPPPGNQHRLEVLMALDRFRSKTNLPLIAHGGFSTDDDIQKALALGAQWVQIG